MNNKNLLQIDDLKDLDYFFKNEIKTMDDFFIFLNLLNRSGKKYIFRGQSNSNLDYSGKIKEERFSPWELESSLGRSLREKNPLSDYFALNFVTDEIIYEIKNTTSQNDDLEILSQMQHSGKPTILIDFTIDIFASLFFAFSNDNFSDEAEGFVSIYLKEIKEKFKNNFKEKVGEETGIYICPKTIQRGISQRSYFMLDNNDDFKNRHDILIVKINFGLKDSIIKFLENKGIDNINIFPDNEGIYENFFSKDKRVNIMKAMALHGLGRYKESVKIYKNFDFEDSKDNKYFKEAYFNGWASSLIKLNLLKEVMDKIEKALIINPKNSDSLLLWGQVLRRNNNYKEAIKKLKMSVEYGQSSYSVFINLGLCLGEVNEYDEAIENLVKASKITPPNEVCFELWGSILFKKKIYEEAKEKFEIALSIDPNSKISLIYLEKINKLHK